MEGTTGHYHLRDKRPFAPWPVLLILQFTHLHVTAKIAAMEQYQVFKILMSTLETAPKALPNI